MQRGKPSDQYKETQVNTANQGKLIVMLYEGAIRFLKIALDNLPKKKFEVVNTNIIKTQEIISELMCSINFEAGDLADKLYSLYSYMNKQLVEANINKKAEPIKEVIRHLEDLNSSWTQIANQSVDSSDSDDDTRPKRGVNISL